MAFQPNGIICVCALISGSYLLACPFWSTRRRFSRGCGELTV